MSQIQRTANHCDVCGHEWLPTSGVDYTHCTSGKCRSRKWNKHPELREYVAPAIQPGPPPKSAMSIPPIMPGSRNATGIERMIESKRAAHDPKTCRIYRCGMCAAKP